MTALPDALVALLRERALCFVATTMPDGSPQLTETWVDTDGEHVVINTVAGFVKTKNLERDPRVAVAIADPQNPVRYFQVRGRAVSITADGGADHIEQLSQKYTGQSYPWWGGRDQTRVIVTIAADSVSGIGG